MTARYPGFKDGTLAVPPEETIEAPRWEHVLKTSLNANTLNEALQSALQLPEREYGKRLVAFRNIVEKFSELASNSELYEALLDGLDTNALNLAVTRLPFEQAKSFIADSSVPLDDVGVSQPPTLSEAIEVAQAWSTTRNDQVYEAAERMFEALGNDSFVAQDLEALQRAKETNNGFSEELLGKDGVVQTAIARTGYYQRFADY